MQYPSLLEQFRALAVFNLYSKERESLINILCSWCGVWLVAVPLAATQCVCVVVLVLAYVRSCKLLQQQKVVLGRLSCEGGYDSSQSAVVLTQLGQCPYG